MAAHFEDIGYIFESGQELVGNAAALKGIPREGRTVSGTIWLSAAVKEVQYQ